MQAPSQPKGVLRFSTHHDPQRWPGVLLPATYNGVMALDLLGELGRLAPVENNAVASFLKRFRTTDGTFAIPEMPEGEVFKKPDRQETWCYIRFHLTNCTLGALQALDAHDDLNLAFIEPFLDSQYLEAWLSRRDMRDPWQEGNNIVNLGSFLLLLRERGDAAAQASIEGALAVLFDWHDRLQEPSTGFWGVDQAHNSRMALHAMAGATHNFHLWYACNRTLPYFDKAIDSCLALPTATDSARIDVDEVDILAHGHLLAEHRREEARSWLLEKLMGLLALQCNDGGFFDERHGVRRVDGSIGENIEASLLVVMQVMELGVKQVIAKAVTPLHGKILQKLGVKRVIFPEREMAIRVAHTLVVPNVLDYIELSRDFSIVELPAPAEWVGKSLRDVALRPRFGLTLVAIKRRSGTGDGEITNIAPMAEDVIGEGDVLALLGDNDRLAQLDRLLGK